VASALPAFFLVLYPDIWLDEFGPDQIPIPQIILFRTRGSSFPCGFYSSAEMSLNKPLLCSFSRNVHKPSVQLLEWCRTAQPEVDLGQFNVPLIYQFRDYVPRLLVQE
jgi:hypothetical protein